jgi:uncharacterized membrane protein
MNIKKMNMLELILKQLKVKFTKTYTRKFYSEHFDNKSLFGISQMLFDYNVPNTAIRMREKKELSSLKKPFVANLQGKNVVIKHYTENDVWYIDEGKEIRISIETFKNLWDGVALIPEKNESSIEPQYKENLKKHIFHIIREISAVVCMVLLFLIGFISNNLYSNPGLLLLSIINAGGVYIGYLLVQKQLYIQNNHADKICSLFKKNGCNDVLNSSAAKFLGVIGWSEIGFSYFISNLIATILFPYLIGYLALINICALPYSFWSVWYQRFKVKQWCPMCLIVQVLFWFIFIINFILGFISIPESTATEIFLTGIIYIAPFLFISLLLPMIMDKRRLHFQSQAMNNLKMKPEIFKALLKQESHYDVDLSTSLIVWGNSNSNILISIVTNPHCSPCADMHKEVDKLLKKAGDSICVQYIFSAYNEELESSNKFLAAVYFSDLSMKKKQAIYNEWFEKGKYQKEEFFEKYRFDLKNPKVIEEINKHKEWKNKIVIKGTPTILVNGYEFPDYYKIEDIIYFNGLNIA